jgi:hypothetical protein
LFITPLLQFVDQQGLMQTLKGAGPFTFFAPNQDAMYKGVLAPLWSDAQPNNVIKKMIVPELAKVRRTLAQMPQFCDQALLANSQPSLSSSIRPANNS